MWTRPEQARTDCHTAGRDWVLFRRETRKKKQRRHCTHTSSERAGGDTTRVIPQSTCRAPVSMSVLVWLSGCRCLWRFICSAICSVCVYMLSADSLPGAGLVLAVAVERATWEGVEIVFTSWSWLSTEERLLTAPWNEPLRLNVLTTSICRTETKQQHSVRATESLIWMCPCGVIPCATSGNVRWWKCTFWYYWQLVK